MIHDTILCSDWGEGGLGFTTTASKSNNATRRLNFQCSLTKWRNFETSTRSWMGGYWQRQEPVQRAVLGSFWEQVIHKEHRTVQKKPILQGPINTDLRKWWQLLTDWCTQVFQSTQPAQNSVVLWQTTSLAADHGSTSQQVHIPLKCFEGSPH